MGKITGNLENVSAAYGSMSLALAAVSMPTAAQAGAVTWYTDLSTANGPIYFDPFAGTGQAGSVVSASDFELLTSVRSFVTKARLLVSPNAATPNGNNFLASASLIYGGGAFSAGRLSPGAAIAGNMMFSSLNGTLADNSSPGFGHWNSTPAAGDIGLEFVSGNPTLYGWANITVNADYTVTLNSFGYDDSGDAVVAGSSTPEPASILLLALGAAGIGAWRKKKARADAS